MLPPETEASAEQEDLLQKIKKDVALREFWKNNDRFADLFNTVFFKGEKVLKPEDMQEQDTNVSAVLSTKEFAGTFVRYRDVVKYAHGMQFAVFGIENQDKIHYAMPLRCRIYDDLEYLRQVQKIAERHRREKDWKGSSGDEFLSGMKRTDRLKACLTIVIYYGEKEWDGPCSLLDMVEMPKEIQSYFQDYRMYLLCVRDEDGCKFSQTDVRDLFHILNSFYHNREEQLKGENLIVSRETYHAVAAVQNNDKLLKAIIKEETEEVSMCSALERIWEDGRKEGVKEGIKEMVAKLLEQSVLSKEQIAEAAGMRLEELADLSSELEAKE